MFIKNKTKKQGLVSKFLSCKIAFADEMNTVVNNGTSNALSGGVTAKLLDNHVRAVYSKEIMFKALPLMQFYQFAKIKTELKEQPGLVIQMMTYNNLKKGGKLNEGVDMKSQSMSSAMKNITIEEYGNAVAMSELALKASFTNLMNDATYLLGRDLSLTLDCMLRDTAMKGAVNVVYGREDKKSPKIASRDKITEASVFSSTTVKDALEILSTNNAPKFGGRDYVCLLHPHQARDLTDDPHWRDVNVYAGATKIFNGEIGKLDGVRYVETTLMPNGACGKDDPSYDANLVKSASGSSTTSPVYQALIMGEDYYGFAVGLDAELRDAGTLDFGRKHGLAWYAIWGAGILDNSRAVRIETC